ncbi:uncharacterized protein J3R85_000714 [Psidium guajava]|nr:uncharacterized protein J3R85_000714 [Psidium guajava]
MAKTSQPRQNQKEDPDSKKEDSNKNAATKPKAKRTRKSVPRDSPQRRSSAYRGVTRHRWTGRYEAHLWDKNCWNESQNKKGRQVYLGAYDDEEAAAHAYDLAALKYWGPQTVLNFPLSAYEEELKEMEGQSKEEYIGSVRRKSSGFSRGVSKFRGVARHHHNGRWEARIGRVLGNKYLYLGTYATQEEAATAYDMAAIEYRGLNAVTNFDLSRYVKWLRPGALNGSGTDPNYSQLSPDVGEAGDRDVVGPAPHRPQGGSPASSALSFLLQSSKFKEMLERTRSAEDRGSATSSSESEAPRRSFPDDIQTYFDCHDTGGLGDDGIFGDLNSFASPVFYCELDV